MNRLLRVEKDPQPVLPGAEAERKIKIVNGRRGVFVRVLVPGKEPDETYIGGRGGLELVLPKGASIWARAADKPTSLAVREEAEL